MVDISYVTFVTTEMQPPPWPRRRRRRLGWVRWGSSLIAVLITCLLHKATSLLSKPFRVKRTSDMMGRLFYRDHVVRLSGAEAGARPSQYIRRRPPFIRTLLIDNYDSYTYNLAHYLAVVNGLPPVVVYNDAFDGNWGKLMASVGAFDNIVLSPGPGTPENPNDFGLCRHALLQSTFPVLGECVERNWW